MESRGSGDRQAILDTALAEVVAKGIDEFTVEGVAGRAGVDPGVITQTRGDRRVLLLEAQLGGAAQRVPIPDTGSLRDDLRALMASSAELAKTAHGRRWVHRFVAAGGDADLSEVRSDFWRVRIDDLVTVLRRAGERGELHDGVDPYEAMRMFAGATLLDIIVADTPIRPDYIVQMLDIFVRGVSKNPAS
jgi:AcrR family transcriptional regulator